MSSKQPPEGYLFSKGYSFYVFGLICLLMLFDFADRMIVASLMPFLKTEYGLSDAQGGSLVSAVYWAMFIFAFPISILVDRWSRRKVTSLMASLWSVASAACAFTKSFPQLLMARSGIGIGEAGYAPAGTAMLSGLFPPEKRSRMMGLWNMSIPLGIAVGIAVGGFVAQHWGWRHAFGLVALPGAIAAILFFFVKDYKTVALEQTVVAPTAGTAAEVQKKKMTIFAKCYSKSGIISWANSARSYLHGQANKICSIFLRIK